MRNFRLMVLAMAAALILAPAALAQPQGLYFTPKIGYSHLKAKTNADGEVYVNGSRELYGVSDSNSKGQTVLGLAVGYDFKPVYDVPLRAEFEYAWRGKKEMFNSALEVDANVSGNEKFKVGAQSFFVNAYFDIHNSSPVTPYIGAGLGLASVSADYQASLSDGTNEGGFGFNKTKTNFAWNIGAGAAWKISDMISLDLGYRYADFGKVKASSSGDFVAGALEVDFDLNTSTKVSAQEVLLGLRFSF